MPVFDSEAVTTLANQDPGTDHALPPGRALNYKAIFTDQALQPPLSANPGDTTGVDCDLVRGKRTQLIIGPRNEHITDTLRTVIDQSETRYIKVDFTEVIDHDHSESIGGSEKRTIRYYLTEDVHGTIFRHYYSGGVDTFDDDHTVEHASVLFHKSLMTVDTTDFLVTMSNSQVNIAIDLLSVLLADLSLVGLTLAAHMVKGEEIVIDELLALASAEVKAVHAPVKTEVAVRTSANAGIDLDTAFPPA